MAISSLVVLNTVQAGGVDSLVDSSGNLQTIGAPTYKARTVNVSILAPVTEVLQVATATISTVTNSATYEMAVNCFDNINGNELLIPLSFTADASATANEIATGLAAQLNGTSGSLSVVGSVDGSDRFAITAKTGKPIFPVLTTNDGKITINAISGSNGTTVGVVGNGLGSALQVKYSTNAGFYTAGVFPQAVNIEAASTYYQVLVTSRADGNQYAILVKSGVTNVNDLIGTYGTLTALQSGYRAILGTRTASATAAITVTTGAIALASGGTFSGSGIVANDFLLIGATYGAEVITKVLITTSDTAGIGSNIVAASAAVYRPIQWRNFPE